MSTSGELAAEQQNSAGCVHPYPAVRLRGLPFGASKEEIADFLGIIPIDIVFQERGGRPNGVAFVLCASIDDHQQALGQDKQNLGTRYIEVFACIRTVRYHLSLLVLLCRLALHKEPRGKNQKRAVPAGVSPGGGG